MNKEANSVNQQILLSACYAAGPILGFCMVGIVYILVDLSFTNSLSLGFVICEMGMTIAMRWQAQSA